ncbi:MAG TPA: peptidoglycan DD-metalloendopeptidase family protein [Burkholderiaceae bacterium]|jgi:septal ring factor EnvC (AmiA/AmiB activator)
MIILLLGVSSSSHAANLSERTKQKRAAESEHADLQRKLSAIKHSINQTETAKDRAADALTQSEQAISETNRSLFDLAQEQQQTQAKLNQLSEQQAKLNETVMLQQNQLAKVMREQYVTGNEDRTKLLLSGDNPNRINRELRYMGYVSQAQTKLIDTLRVNLQGVETNKAETQSAKDELDEIAQETRDQKALLEKEKAHHATLLAQLSNKLTAQRKEAGTLQRDEQRLAGLVSKLDKLIEEQRKADLAAAEKRRQKELAARAKQKRQLAKNKPKGNSAKGKIINPDAIDDDEAPKSLGRNELTPDATVENNVFTKEFSSLRGQLHLPLRGELIAKFGSKRGDGPSWKGLFIRAPEGTEVKAVAGGRVIFADWLRGFGNLIIIDHGSQYMTIYGNNQAVLKHSGDIVKTGDVIANAGNSGGNEQSGLYFEMRHQGRAFDPLDWVTIR